jgi:pimeloyl-ACP methyl ester carboxylesterase
LRSAPVSWQPGGVTADELHFPRTGDGWRLALHRYRPRSATAGPPVILCGGYACNRYLLDYDENYSLARFLARTGFDAWVLEPRGCGLAHPEPEGSPAESWNFDDLVNFDAPAAIEHVASSTGREVVWLGHSLGGMLLYAYLGRCADRDPLVAAGVTIAAPVVFPAIRSPLIRQVGPWLLSLPISDMVRQRWIVALLWGLLDGSWGLIGSPSALRLGVNPDNIDREMIGRAMRTIIGDVPRAKLKQLAQWALDGAFASADGQIDYRAGLAKVNVPLLVTAGSADVLAPPSAVRRALDHLPSGRGSYLEFGRASGHSADYGHIDLILGRDAPLEVFPPLVGWIAEQVRGPRRTAEAAPLNEAR